MSAPGFRLPRLSLKGRLTLLIGGISALSLGVAFLGFSLYERAAIRRGLVRSLETQAQILSPVAAADLDFGSLLDSTKALAALASNRHIEAARIFDAQGRVFATRVSPGSTMPLPERPSQGASAVFHDRVLDLSFPILLDDQFKGTLFLRADLGQIREQESAALRAFSAAGLGLLLLVVWVGAVLQRKVSDPVLQLAETAGKVSLTGDFSLRIPGAWEGELGTLARAFNGMLEHIQAGDRKLLAYQDHLEEQVVRRSELLLQSQRLLSATLDALPACIAILDARGEVLNVNGNWRDYGDPGNPLVHGIHPGDDYLAVLRALPPGEASLAAAGEGYAAFAAGEADTWRQDYEFQGGDGPRWFQLLATRFRAGEAPHTVVMHIDQSDQKRMELQLRQSQKLESIGQLAAGIAHEINTPIQFIGDNATFLKRAFQDLLGLLDQVEADPATAAAFEAADLPYLGAEIPRALDESLEGVGRVSRIVRALKEFSHPGNAAMTPTDLNKLIENAAIVSRSEWKYVADLQLELDPDLPAIPCHPDQINQVLLNLIINASHAVADAQAAAPGGKGTIRIRTRPVPEGAEVRVEDSGTGIPPEIRNRIFDPFFTTKPLGKGTGQGLSLAYATVVHQHGGTITVASAPGKGAAFTILLPRAGA